jgi:hypothetical protein
MIGITVSHDRILNKLIKSIRSKYLSRLECGYFQQASTKTPPDVLKNKTEQPGHIKRRAEFLQLMKLQRG